MNIKLYCLQLSAALASDSSTLLALALTKLDSEHKARLPSAVVEGVSSYNGTYGLDCYSHDTLPWQYGQNLLEYLKEVCDFLTNSLHVNM